MQILAKDREPAAPLISIRPVRGWVPVNLHDLFDYRDLLVVLTWRDLSARYKQTYLGLAWAVVQPLMLMIVFSMIFGGIGKLPCEGLPYPLFSYSALLLWQYFVSAVNGASTALYGSSALITKVYFPRLIIPLSAILPPLIDCLAALCILVCLMVYFGQPISWRFLFAPLFLALTMLSALGAGLWSGALGMQYRDLRQLIPFGLQILMFVSPVIYPAMMLPHQFVCLYALNPLVGSLEGFRWATLGASSPDLPYLITTATIVSLLIFFTGLLYFRQVEHKFADII